jgi:hypothetical protein
VFLSRKKERAKSDRKVLWVFVVSRVLNAGTQRSELGSADEVCGGLQGHMDKDTSCSSFNFPLNHRPSLFVLSSDFHHGRVK